MYLDASLAAMPRSNAAWSFLHGRRSMVAAFTISVTLHLSVWLATPYFIWAWHEPAAARFDAVIVPIVEAPATSVSAITGNTKRTWRAAKSTAPRRATPPKTKADFAAPENAIAVDSTQDRGEANAGIASAVTDEKPAIETENSTDPAPAPSMAEVAAPTTPVAAEQPEPPSPAMPSRISIAYMMTSTISDGVADYQWTRDGDRFEIDSTMQATGFIVGNFVGVLHQVSKGSVTPGGLQPDSYRIRRGDSPPDTADFLRASNELKLTRAGETRLLPLPPLIQDMQSFLFQLAYDAPKLRRPEDRIEVLVTNARKVYRYRFQQVGAETVQTRAGAVPTVHLRSETSDPDDTYEVWLAPDSHHLPVKIRFHAGRFPIELIAASIRTTP